MYKSYKEQFEQELKEIKDGGMWKDVGVLEGKQGAEVNIGGKDLLIFAPTIILDLLHQKNWASRHRGVKQFGFGEASVLGLSLVLHNP